MIKMTDNEIIENMDQLISNLKGMDKDKVYLIELTEEAVSNPATGSLVIGVLRKLLSTGIKAFFIAPNTIKNIYTLDNSKTSDTSSATVTKEIKHLQKDVFTLEGRKNI